jgi:uncharacterized membrane-anchored protein
MLPENEIAPMRPPITASELVVVFVALMSATAEIPAAAPPPMPLKSAIIWGISVMATRFAAR